MNKKMIGLSVAIIGVGLIGTYVYLRIKKKGEENSSSTENTPSDTSKKSTIGTVVDKITKPLENILTPSSNVPTKNGEIVYAKVDTSIYSYPTLGVSSMIKGVKKDERIGTFIKKISNYVSEIFVGGDIRYVVTDKIYTK